VIASVLAAMEGADPQRAAFLALWHDSQETRTTDLPHLTQNYVSAAANEQVTRDQVAPLPPPGRLHRQESSARLPAPASTSSRMILWAFFGSSNMGL
jgi:hypothetical protein